MAVCACTRSRTHARILPLLLVLLLFASLAQAITSAHSAAASHHHSKRARHSSSSSSRDAAGGSSGAASRGDRNLPRVPPSASAYTYDPVANTKAVVVAGKARFTVLTDSLVRMEWRPDAVFDDAATWKVTVRNLPVPPFTASYDGALLTIQTQYFTLEYDSSSVNTFSRDNLKVTVALGAGRSNTWQPGYARDHQGNLFGTLRTLDQQTGALSLDCANDGDAGRQCSYGVLSRAGYAVVDDTHTPLFTALAARWPWIRPRHPTTPAPAPPPAEQCVVDEDHRRDCAQRAGEETCRLRGCCWAPSNVTGAPYCFYSARAAQDLYLFAHGHRYLDALRDLTAISGSIPLPPRFTFGVFYSRYWAYNEAGLEDVIQQYESHGVPLDTLVIDMDWHLTFYRRSTAGEQDQAGQSIGWTGFTWDSRLFPNATEFLQWVHSRGLHVTLNVHPAAGLQPWEDKYAVMAQAMGIDPASQHYVPLNLTDQTFVSDWMSLVMNPLEAQGVDFWWLDWQQGEEWISPDDEVSPTFWLNYVFATNPYSAHPNQRPLLMHRWGGLGNHRYPIGFSGDTAPNWEVLDFQPYFTLTASNVGYGYWSHDLGGHTAPSPPELYTRWVQWGAFSPIFRTHCTKDGQNDRRIWSYPDANFQIMRQAMVLRAALLPYIFSCARVAFDSGVSLLRPLYYYWPEIDEAYTAHNQYLFGDELLVAPITSPMNNVTAVATRTIWVPPGEWVSYFSLKRYSGPATVSENFTLREIPVFARAGAIVPLAIPADTSVGQSQYAPTALQVLVFPAAANGSFVLYEDDGISQAYASGESAATKFAFAYSSNSVLDFSIGAVQGSYSGMPNSRRYSVQFRGVYPPVSVELAAAPLPPCLIRYPTTAPFSAPLTTDSRRRGATRRPTAASSAAGRAGAQQTADSAGETDCWRYDGMQLALVVELRVARALSSELALRVRLGAPADDALFGGLPGYLPRLNAIKDILDDKFGWSTSSSVFHDDFPHTLLAAQAGHRMSYRPETAVAEVHAFAQALNDSVTEMFTVNVDDSTRARLLALLPQPLPAAAAGEPATETPGSEEQEL